MQPNKLAADSPLIRGCYVPHAGRIYDGCSVSVPRMRPIELFYKVLEHLFPAGQTRAYLAAISIGRFLRLFDSFGHTIRIVFRWIHLCHKLTLQFGAIDPLLSQLWHDKPLP